jgi:disulfide oxidoreductase YuzD
MKTLLFGLTILLIFGFNSTITKCVQVSCSKTTFVMSFTGTNEADIANQIKQKYPNCSFTYVDKSRCKK